MTLLSKTASSSKDLKQALELRHKVFIEEWLGSNHKTGLDFATIAKRRMSSFFVIPNLNIFKNQGLKLLLV